MTDGQSLSNALAHRLLEDCAKFCDENLVRHRGIDEAIMCIVACQGALLGLLAKHRNGDYLRALLAESMVDGTAERYIAEMNQTKEGLDS